MINKNSIISFSLSAVITLTAQSQDTSPKVTQKVLKEVYTGKFLMGTASDLRRLTESELENIKTHYNILTPENCMKPQSLHPSENRYNFAIADSLVDWCTKNGIKIWGHTLVWHAQTPPWFFQAVNPDTEDTVQLVRPPRMQWDPNAPRPTPEEMWRRSIKGELASREVALQRLEKHIKTVVGRYKGRVIGWDVVNEAIADSGDCTTENLRTFSWYQVVGPEVISLAFKWAHEADPDAQLYYNDYNIEEGAAENKGKHASSLILLKRLLAEGVPITGVGIQGHWNLNTNLADVEKAIENYAALGLRVSITELDVTATGGNSGAFDIRQGNRTIPPENYIKQAEIYKKLFEIFLRHADVIDRVTFWGISDGRSWRWGQDALLFDRQLKPKPAFDAVIEASSTSK
jgi:endo-1,4-beta-xylanase